MLINSKEYIDIPFFLTKNSYNNDLNVMKNANAIRSSVKNLILTIPGERPFSRKIGSLGYIDGPFVDTENFLDRLTLTDTLYSTIYYNENRIKDLFIIIEEDKSINIKFTQKSDTNIINMTINYT